MFYKLAKRFFGVRSSRIKLLALAGAHMMKTRYIGIFIDPVMACNLRCKMCYFSDDEKRPRPLKPMDDDYISRLRKALFHRALKMQIGCGAEPTLYTRLPSLVKSAKESGIPYVEITTNGQLLNYDKLRELCEEGLDGMTLSVHGTRRETYEYLMGRADFDKLKNLIDIILRIKEEFPAFHLRVNYTFNNLNVAELRDIFTLFDGVKIDTLQIRPIQNLGDTEYADFDLNDIAARYDELIQPLIDSCKAAGTMFIGPSLKNLTHVDKSRSVNNEIIERLTYCYVSTESCYHADFDLDNDSFESYHRRHHTLRRLVGRAFSLRKKPASAVDKTKKMNYTIK